MRLNTWICGLVIAGATCVATAETRRPEPQRVISKEEAEAIRWEKAKQAAADRQLRIESGAVVATSQPAAAKSTAPHTNGVAQSGRLVTDPQALREAIRWEKEKVLRAERQIRIETELAAKPKPRPAETTETAPDEPNDQ